jgi:hypothetical protein
VRTVGNLLLDLLADKVTSAVAASVAVKSWSGCLVPETRGDVSLVVKRQSDFAASILRLSQDEGVALGLGIFRSAVSGGGDKGGVADSAGNVAADVSGKLEVDRVDGSGFHILAEEEFGDSDGSQRRE